MDIKSSCTKWQTFVLHVKKGYEDREEHISRMMKKMNIAFEYILDGDMQDITKETLEKYFTGEMKINSPATSCALKHLLACHEIVERKIEGALVLEDDIVLHDNFVSVFQRSIDELKGNSNWNAKPVIINYEDTRLRFVPRSKRVEGRVLYEGDRDRMAGAIYVNHAAAKLIWDYAIKDKLDQPIDLFHCYLLKKNLIAYLWCQPVVATQGSHSGLFMSGININKNYFDILKWKFNLLYKKMIYYFR